MTATQGLRLARLRQTNKPTGPKLKREWHKQLLVLFVLLLIWEAIVRIDHINPLILPAPSRIARKFFELLGNGTLLTAAWNTFFVLLESVAIGTAIAIVLAAIGVFTSLGGLVLRTLASVMNPLPGVALLPLVIIWLGFGHVSMIVVVLNTVVWVVAINLYTGFQTTPLTLRRVARSLELSSFAMLRDVYLPSAIPSALTGLRMAWSYGWRTIISVELVLGATSGQSGLGTMIYSARYNFDTDELFSGLVAIVLIGFAIEQMIRYVERKTAVRWGMLEQV